MIWFFEKDDESLRVETQYDDASAEFVVVVRQPDGQQRTERFADIGAFRTWIETFDRQLAFEHWTARNGPIILPYGWPSKRLM